MQQRLTHTPKTPTIPVFGLFPKDLQAFLSKTPDHVTQWVHTMNFEALPRTLCVIPKEGGIDQVLYGKHPDPFEEPWDMAFLAESLPIEQTYDLQHPLSETQALAWLLSSHTAKEERDIPCLKAPQDLNIKWIQGILESIVLIRRLINTPANHMGPHALSSEIKSVAEKHGAHFEEIMGENLEKGYPLTHAVGKAGAQAPRFVHVKWGEKKNPHLALIGKGVTFDTGGLNLKPGRHMDLMKKDMGGAAHALGLAHLIMTRRLPVHLDLYIPIVENAIGPNALRPGDIIPSRKGITVEIGDTDAEGRLILADALTRAFEEKVDHVIDCATLTGGARVAMGTEIPAFFTNGDPSLLQNLSMEEKDPLWPLPLWNGYKNSLKSTAADLKNVAPTAYGSAITAALFLEHFVEGPWIHVDLMAWNLRNRPGRPVGGEAQGLRSLYAYIEKALGL